MDARHYSPSAARNRDAILAVLRRTLPAQARVLEIASGSGEHAVHFAAAMAGVRWRPSDPEPEARASISAWIAASRLANISAPLAIDVRAQHWLEAEAEAPYDAIVAINMIHIAPWESTLGLLAGAGRLLAARGLLMTYGPYMRDGRHTAPSNEVFDTWLKERDPSFGVRDLDAVASAAAAHGLSLVEIAEMPANNFVLVFARRHASVAGGD